MTSYFVPVTVPVSGRRHYYPRHSYAPTEAYNRPSVFSDMTLDLLPFLLSDYPAFCYGVHRCEKEKKPVVKPWTKVLKVKGYDPEDIKVMVENDKAIIHCRHEEKDGENVDLIESRRSVPLPQNVDPATVKTFMIDEDSLVIQAQFKKPPQETAKKAQAAKETKTEQKDGTERKLPIVIEQKKSENQEQERKKEESCLFRTETPIVSEYNEEKRVVETHEEEPREIEPEREEWGKVTPLAEDDSRGEKTTCKFDSPICEQRSESSCEFNGQVCCEQTWGDIPLLNADEDTESTVRNDADWDLPFADKNEIVEKDGTNVFMISLSLKGFDPNTVSVRYMSDQLEVSAKQEYCNEGFTSYKEVHRRYTLPEGADVGCTKATMNDSRVLKISVPINPK